MVEFEAKRYKVFEHLCRKHFSFLIGRYNFSLENVEEFEGKGVVIRYGSKKVFVYLPYFSPSFELYFTFGLKGKHDRENVIPMNSGDLVLLDKCSNYKNYAAFSATSFENLEKCLPKLAELLGNCGSEYLLGNYQAYKELERKRDVDRINFEHEWEIKNKRLKAEEAWQKKEYILVVQTLNSIQNELTGAEKKKLKFAKKMIGKTS